ncbi:hypothetical protein SCLCIDRAFT_1215749 [Scleroderma citrinum Foug A]|uniref:Uncharacterized protein n=1 Tax=Scleroderma citrinum Foug A TaxID=1036808 RepID=A0A0C2ZJ95_9AGAM|nr:hypothetical protein SCLCIDRAFT_1215749 [Scleroderma citrinum Foug A]
MILRGKCKAAKAPGRQPTGDMLWMVPRIRIHHPSLCKSSSLFLSRDTSSNCLTGLLSIRSPPPRPSNHCPIVSRREPLTRRP